MSSKEKIMVKAIISRILLDMKEQKYAEYTIYRYQLCYERLLEFMEQRGQQFYNSGIGIEYIQTKFGITIEGLFGKHLDHTGISRHNRMIAGLCKNGKTTKIQ